MERGPLCAHPEWLVPSLGEPRWTATRPQFPSNLKTAKKLALSFGFSQPFDRKAGNFQKAICFSKQCEIEGEPSAYGVQSGAAHFNKCVPPTDLMCGFPTRS